MRLLRRARPHHPLAEAFAARSIRHVVMRGDCCSARTLALQRFLVHEQVRIDQSEKAPSVLFLDAMAGRRTGVETLRAVCDVDRLDRYQRHYYLAQSAVDAVLQARDADLIVLDSYADMNFPLWEHRQTGAKLWVDAALLRDRELFERDYRHIGRRSFTEALRDSIALVRLLQRNNPRAPVLYLTQPIDYYAALAHRSEFCHLGAELARRLPGVYWGGALPFGELVPDDMDSCGPGETLHFSAATYGRMVARAMAQPTAASPSMEDSSMELGLPLLAPLAAATPANAPMEGRDAATPGPGIAAVPSPADTAAPPASSPCLQFVGGDVPEGFTSAPGIPAFVEGRSAVFRMAAGTIECRPGCEHQAASVPKSLGAYCLFEGDRLDRKMGYHPALIDLQSHADYAAFQKAFKKLSGGNKLREAHRAKAAGYRCEIFPWKLHIPDIVDVNGSKEVRSGGSMREGYRKTVEQMGGAPQSRMPVAWPICSYHWAITWGVFLDEPGHRQGAVQVDQRLVGYVSLKRYGNVVLYSQILGHGAHLQAGAMVLLHLEIVRWLYACDMPFTKGLRYVMYGGWESGGADLQNYKRRIGFLPYRVAADMSTSPAAGTIDERGLTLAPLAAHRLPTSLGRLPDDVAAAPPIGADLGRDRSSKPARPHDPAVAPGEPLPALEAILDAARRAPFPLDVLAGATTSAAFFCGGFDGRNDVAHLHQQGLSVQLIHDPDAAKVQRVRQLFGIGGDAAVAGDAFVLARQLADAGRRFDVVTCNPFSNLMRRVSLDEVACFARLAVRALVCGIDAETLAGSRLVADAGAIDAWLSPRLKESGSTLRVDRLLLRNAAHRGGTYWIVLRADAVDGGAVAAAKEAVDEAT